MTRAPKLQPYSDEEIAADPELAAALLRDAEPLLAIEQQIKALREQKADLFDDLRCSRFKPEFAKAWVASQMADEDKDAAKAEKEVALDRVVSAMEAARTGKARARAGARPRIETKAARQEEFDKETGEIEEPAPGCMADPSPEDEALAAALKAAASHVMTDDEREVQARSFAYGNAALDNPLVTRAMVASAPYRVTDPAPAPVAPVEDAELPAFLDRRNWRDGKPLSNGDGVGTH